MKELESYVHDCYRKETFLKAYNNIMYPINGVEMWEKIRKEAALPPKFSKPPGRPKKARRKEPDEAPKNPTKLGTFRKNLSCRKCGQNGHNTGTCKSEVQSLRNNNRGPPPMRPSQTSPAPFNHLGPMYRLPPFNSQGPIPRRPPPVAMFNIQDPSPMRPPQTAMFNIEGLMGGRPTTLAPLHSLPLKGKYLGGHHYLPSLPFKG